MVWTCSLVLTRSGFLSLRRAIQTHTYIYLYLYIYIYICITLLCSTGVFKLDTQGAGTSLTPLQIITPNLPFGITLFLSLSLLGIHNQVLQEESLTALILAGNSPQLLGFYYTDEPKKTKKQTNKIK